ncbi:seawater-induced protein 61-2 [Myxococcus sp. Y35]|uniref:seawater-induced protein 61-2 n=1 Tax=Pseudomyxococcus flavus TaxID=3115648 RepID=UPI003CEBD1B1
MKNNTTTGAIILALAGIWFTACGNAPPDGDVELSTQTTAAPLGLATTSTCTPAQVSWDQNPSIPDEQQICAGSWEYQTYVSPCYAATDSSACPLIGYEQKTCTHYHSCRDPAFGIERFETINQTPVISGTRYSVMECLPGHGCQQFDEYDYDNQGGCSASVRTLRDSLLGGWHYTVTSTWSEGPITIVSVNGDVARFTQECYVTLFNVPLYYQRAEAPCPISHTTQCDDTSSPIYEICRHESHGEAPTESECGLANGGARTASPRGLSLESLKTTHDTAAAIDLAPHCTTCDNLPMQNASDVNAKYTCIRQRLARLIRDSKADVTERNVTATQLRRLIEMRGDELTEANLADALSIYRNARFRSNCGNDLMVPEVSPTCDPTFNHDRSFLETVCHPLALDHVQVAVTRQFLDECIDFIENAPLDPQCGLQPYAVPYRDVSISLLKKVFAAPHGPSGASRQQTLIHNLAAIERWRHHSLHVLHSSDNYLGAPPQFWEELSVLMSAFWKGAYDSEQQIGTTLTPEALDDLSAAYMKVDREILLSAFAPESYVQSALLLPVMSDAFHGMVDRLRVASASHDLACRYLTCASGQLNTEVSQLWKLLSVLDDGAALQNALNSATKVRSEWRAVFQAIVNQHSRMDAAVSDALGQNPLPPGSPLRTWNQEQIPQIALGMSQLLREAHARTTSYEAHGLFDSLHRNVLSRGMNTGTFEQEWFDDELDRVRDNLSQRISEYTSTRTALIQNLLANLQTKQVETSGMWRITALHEHMKVVSEDLAGLRNNVEVANVRQGDFMEAFDELVATTDLNLLIQQDTVPPIMLSAGNAVYAGGSPNPETPIADIAARTNGTTPWMMATEAGDFLTLAVTGQWSPTCAISQGTHRLPGDPNTTRPIRVTRTEQGPNGPQTVPVLTGPEGFLVNLQNSNFQAISKQSVKEDGTYRTFDQTSSTCAGMEASYGSPSIVDVWGASFRAYVKTEACLKWDWGERSSSTEIDNNANGSESRSVAAFTTGLRAANTPFPQLPAGSLLLLEVERPPDSTQALRSHIRNIHLVQAPHTSIAIDRASDLYLVVNDKTGCGPTATGSLTVNISHSRPLAASIQQLGRAMAAVREDLRSKFPDYLRQGRLHPQDLSALRSQAFARLAAECNCDVNDPSKIPTTFNGLFSAWLEHDLSILQRQVEILAVRREQDILALELRALRDELASAQEESRWVRMLPLWNLRNLDGSQLDSTTREVVAGLNQYLYPIIHLRYPSVITAIANDSTARSRLMHLVDMDWMAPALDRAESILDVEFDIRDKFASARAAANHLTPKFVALSFPRPGAPADTPYRKVSDSRSAQMWNHLLTTGIAPFTVLPEDFYSASGGHAQLLCFESSPIIRAMGLFARVHGSDGNALSGALATRALTQFGSQLAFPTLAGLETYQQDNAEWHFGGLPVNYGGPFDALSEFDTRVLPDRAGNGLSPFTQFDVDGTALFEPIQPGEGPLIDTVSEFVLVFQVEPRQLTQPMTWLRTCPSGTTLTSAGLLSVESDMQ